MKRTAVALPFVLLSFLVFCFPVRTQEIHRWVDREGNIHYTTKSEWIPEEYRGQVKERRAREKQQDRQFTEEKPKGENQIPVPKTPEAVETPDEPIEAPHSLALFILKSPAFEDKGKIPARYSRRGGNASPPLMWQNPPPGTKSYVLTLTDPDAPGGPFTHWVIYNISGDQASLPESVPRKIFAKGAQQTRNDFNSIGYGGPDPVGRVRRYVFRLRALDLEKITKPRKELLEEHTLAETTLTVFYP